MRILAYGMIAVAFAMMIPGAYAELPDVVRVGALVPISGDGSGHGEDIRVTIDLAEASFNEYLEESGESWRLDVIQEDTASSPVIALDKLTSHNAKGIKLIVGTYSSAELRNIIGYAEANDMLLISYGSTAPSLSIPDDNVYRFVPDETNQAPALGGYLGEQGITNVVPIWRGDAWGDGFIAAMRTQFAEMGISVDEGIRYHPEAIEFSTEIGLLADSVQENIDEVGADKVAVIILSFSEITPVMQAADQYDHLSQVLWMGTDTIINDTEFEEDPIAQRFVDRSGLVVASWAPSDNPIADKVNQDAANISGRQPNIYAMAAYDVVWAIGLSIQESGSMESDGVVSVLRDVLVDYDGVLGKIILNEAGDIGEGVYNMYSVENAEWLLAASYDSTTDTLTFYDATETRDVVTPEDEDAAGDGAMEDDSGGCLIATAAYGSELSPQVQMLREIRDSTLFATESGTAFMSGFNEVYYSFSPGVADLEMENPAFRDAVRTAITPGVYTLGIMTLADHNSEQSVTLFGILTLAAIGGIYIGGPAVAVHAVIKARSRMRDRARLSEA